MSRHWLRGKRSLAAAVAVAAIAALALSLVATSAAGGQTKKPPKAAAKTGAIRIESWLSATPNQTGLAGTVKACFKLTGALTDQNGGPTWTSGNYEDTTTPAAKCKDWKPVGGFLFVPPTSGNYSTLYAVHTISGQKGLIFITFAGAYDLVSTYQGSGSWVITGGTGAYSNIQGEGTWTANASKFPYIRHTEIGTISRSTAT